MSTLTGGRVRAVAIATVAATLWAAPAEASPLDLFGFGGRSPGMAGTGVATVTDFDASWINPAGLADVRHKRVTFGFMYADMDLQFDGADTGTESVRGLVFGGALPLPLGGKMRDRIGIALGFHVPPNAVNRARAPFPGVPTYALLETRGHTVGIQLAAGYKVNPWLRVGAGVQSFATLDGGIHVFTDRAGRFATRSEQELVTKLVPLIGARALVRELDAQVGLVFRGEARTDYRLVVTNDLLDSLPLTVPTITIGGTSQYDPMTVALEVAWQRSRNLVVNLQLAWQNWSAYPQPTVPPVMNAPAQESPGFHDTVVPRLAAQWTAHTSRSFGLVLRGGYAFIPTPAPEMSGRSSLLDNHRHLLSAGVGVVRPPLHIDVWAQTHLLMGRTHTKDLTIYDPDEMAPFESIDTGGRLLVGGITMGVDL